MDTIEYRDHVITITNEDHDLDIFNPREHDNVGTMSCAHRRYDLGDEQVDPEDMTVECPDCVGRGEVPVPTTFAADEDVDTALIGGLGWTGCGRCGTSGEVADPIRWAVERQGATIVLGLYLYDHSGITMRASTLYRDGQRVEGGNPFTCRWDSGMVGIAYDTPQGLRDCFGQWERSPDTGKYVFTGRYLTGDGNPPDAERIEALLHDEVKVYDAYLTGDIVRYNIEGPVCDDGCGGFFPDLEADWSRRFDHVIDEAKAAIDSAIRHETEQVEKIGRMMAL